MPFQKGKATPGSGRKGFEVEQAQLEQMRRILGKDLEIMERYQNKELTAEDEKRLQVLQGRILKIMDKLHISKTQTDITSGGEKIEGINYIIPKNADNDSSNAKTAPSK